MRDMILDLLRAILKFELGFNTELEPRQLKTCVEVLNNLGKLIGLFDISNKIAVELFAVGNDKYYFYDRMVCVKVAADAAIRTGSSPYWRFDYKPKKRDVSRARRYMQNNIRGVVSCMSSVGWKKVALISCITDISDVSELIMKLLYIDLLYGNSYKLEL